MKGLKKHYESFHGVNISDEVLSDTVNLAKRYLNERFMPDKAIDLLDEASASLKVEKSKTSPEIRKLQKELKLINSRIDDAVDSEDYERAARAKTRASQITDELTKLKSGLASSSKHNLKSEDIAEVVARITGVPVRKVIKSEAKYLINLEKVLSENVIGQSEAVEAVAKAIRRNR